VKRRLAIFCMAVWLTGTLWMAIVATQNFYTIYRLLAARPNPAFGAAVEKLGETDAQFLLRYLSSELNRLFFQVWGLVQIGIGILTLWLVGGIPRSAKPKWLIVSMLGICLLFAAVITPEIVSVGRQLDFVPRDPMPPELRTFGLLHATYTVLDGIKFILGILVSVLLIRGRDVAVVPTEAGAAAAVAAAPKE
jgi:hypothetical protein